MSGVRYRFRVNGGRSRMMVLLTLLLLFVPPWMAQAQDASSRVEVYRSPEFGYLTWWDPELWTLETQETLAGSDLLHFVGEEIAVAIWGYADPGATATSCAEDALASIADDENVVRYEALHPAGAAPEVRTFSDGRQAGVSLVLVLDSPDGRHAVVDQEACYAIGPRQVLSTSEWMLAETYNARYGRFGETPAAKLTLPRSAFTFNPGETSPADPLSFTSGSPNLLINPETNEELGLLTYRGPDCAAGNRNPTVVAENTGNTTWMLALGDFSIEEDAGATLDPSPHWLSPAVASNNAVILNPGDVAILEFSGALNYLSTFGDAVYLTPWGTAFPIGRVGIGGCGGGGAPVLIDLE